MKSKRKINLKLIFIFFLIFCKSYGKPPDLIPLPQEAKWGKEIGRIEGKKVVLITSPDEKNSYTTLAIKDFLNKAKATVILSEKGDGEVIIYLGQLENKENIRNSDKFKKLEKSVNPLMLQESYYMKIENRKGKIIIEIAGGGSEGNYFGAQTLKQIIFPEPNKDAPLYEVEIYDWPKFRFRGVIEGGGGRWSHEQRMSFLEFMGEHKMNYFLYIPKGDSKVRREWRKPYSEEEMAQFKEEIALALRKKINFAYGLNPALSAHCGSEKTFKTIIDKFEKFRAIGVEHFGIFFDDILPLRQSKQDREMFSSAAEAHAYLANRLYRYLKSKNPRTLFFFCPTPYWSIENFGYFKVIKEMLDPDIAVGWTGKGVAPFSITLDNAKKFYEITGHQIGLGDNYPVHGDGLCMGTLRNRDPRLFEYIPAFVSNPAWSRPTMTSIPLATIADYTWNPLNYDADRAWEVRIRRFGGSEFYPYLRTLCEMYKEGWPKFDKPDPLAIKRSNLNEAWKKNANLIPHLVEVEKEYQWIKEATSVIKNKFPNKTFVDEIKRGGYFEKLISHAEEGIEKCKKVNEAIKSGNKEIINATMDDLMKFKFTH